MVRALTRTSNDGEAGFTLVELIVVIAIIGIASAAIVLSMPGAGSDLRLEAERFGARARAAQESAILESRAVALRVDTDGYSFARSDEGRWREVARHGWGAGTRPELPTGQARTVFDPTGSADPLELTLRGEATSITIRIDNDGRVALRR